MEEKNKREQKMKNQKSFKNKHLGRLINRLYNKIIQRCFKNEQRTNPKEGFEYESKTPKKKINIKMGTC